MRIRVVGIGMGPQHVTPEAAEALRAGGYVVASAKGPDDALLGVRREVARRHGLEVVVVPDPERDRTVVGQAAYDDAVREWHRARVTAYADVIAGRDGDPVFLVWGDPSLYDSTLRVVDALAARLPAEVEVVAGVSAPSLLAARHRIVLHPVGGPVHVTPARRLAEALAAGQTNVVVMLGDDDWLDRLVDLAGWTVWWGANLGSASEGLAHGALPNVLPALRAARAAARAEAGWVMDVALLRAPA